MLHWLRAAGVALATLAGLLGMNFQPAWAALSLAAIAGFLAVAATDVGIAVAIFALAVPISASNALIGIAFLIVGFLSIRYIGADGGRVFLLIAGAIAGVVYGPAWAVPAIAGYLMGSSAGALAAAVACFSVLTVGLALGTGAALGPVTVNSGTAALLDFSQTPGTLLSVEWLTASLGAIDAKMIEKTFEILGNLESPFAFVVQPLAWASAALVSGALVSIARRRGSNLAVALATGVGAVVPAIGSVLIFGSIGTTIDSRVLVMAVVSSILIAAAFAWLHERFFSLVAVAAPVEPARPSSMAAEDADVDELLRLVATAEEKLATDHTTNKTVMITDMKSFSRMTEEDGSILTAKAVQKHRDLLLPIIEAHGGHGKSTGGDGLVAAFGSSAQAVTAAVEMQRALDRHNNTHSREREMSVRIGIADGEVVLDRGGRPFIGAGLNLAARVMNLADGDQVFTTKAVLSQAGQAFDIHSHGEFGLKNIAVPVEVIEVLWNDNQVPQQPRIAEPGE